MSFPRVPLRTLLREPLRNGKSARTSKNGHGIPVFTLTAVTKGDFSEANTKASVLTEKQADGLWAAPGDIFVQRSNTPELVGTAALYTGRERFAVFPDLLIRVRPDERVRPRFLAYFLKADEARYYFRGKARGMAGSMPKIGQETIAALDVPVPPLDVQDAVVEAVETQFSRLDAAVASLTRAKANARRARASVLKAAVEGRLVPTEAELARAEGRDYEPAPALLARILAERRDRHEAEQEGAKRRKKYKEPLEPDPDGLPELPEGWCWASVDGLTSLVTSGSRGWARYYADSGALFVRSQDINTHRLDLSSVVRVELPRHVEGARTRLSRGDVLVIITGANVTITAWVSQAIEEAYVNQHVALCRPVEEATSPYVHLWLRAGDSGGSPLRTAAYGAGKPGLNLTNIREVALGLPPLAEQHRIVAEVDRQLSVLDALDATIDTNLARCAALRQSILKLAFEGRLPGAIRTPGPGPEAPRASEGAS